MTSQGRTAITFTLSDRRYELTRTDVESRFAGVAPTRSASTRCA
jgi:hypothetical protein